jgi:hypothetical protein
VLDGRNRLLACERAEVEPRFEDFEGDDAAALALVISLNVQRRDLTAGQRAIVAAKSLSLFESTKKPGPKSGTNSATSGRSREDAARVFKVGVNAIQQAKALLSEAADLAVQVESAASSLMASYEELQERRRAAAQKAKDLQRVSKYAEAVSGGEMTLEEALQAVADEERVAPGRRHQTLWEVFPESMITDGRSRYRACLGLGVEPRFVGYDGPEEKLAAHIKSRNLRGSSLEPGGVVGASPPRPRGGPYRRGAALAADAARG